MKLFRVLLIGLSLWLVVLLVGPTHLPLLGSGSQTQAFHASWMNNPKTLDEATKLSSAVVVARVVAINQAPDIVVQKGTANEFNRLPNQRIHVEVMQTLAGTAPKSLALFFTGNDKMFLQGDPHYKVDETYVLFVMEKADEPGIHVVIGPEGRYLVQNNSLRPMVEHKHTEAELTAEHPHDGLAAKLDGMLLSDFQRNLAQLAPAGK